jgi:putative nucleotidyltransferase with HDIG domain
MQIIDAHGLIPISLATLSPNCSLGIDIYLRASAEAAPVLFCAAKDCPDLSRIAPLASQGISKLFIDHAERSSYQRYLREHWSALVQDDSIQFNNRIAVLSEVIRDVLNEEFTIGDTSRIVTQAQKLGASTRNLLGTHQLFARQLIDVLHHDYGTFTHSTNVSFYATILARELGFSEEDQEQVAVGGLLHDLGKLQIDERVLNKPGKLDELEFREIQKHPVTGLMELVDREDISFGQLMMAYQHHERTNGSGYPVGCVESEIHPWARLCAIVDVFEALTSNRPYRKAMNAKTALAVLDRGDGTEFDSEMLHCWRQLINKLG